MTLQKSGKKTAVNIDIPSDVRRILDHFADDYRYGEVTYTRDRKFDIDGREWELCIYDRTLVKYEVAAVINYDIGHLYYRNAFVYGTETHYGQTYTCASPAIQFFTRLQARWGDVDFAIWVNEMCTRKRTLGSIGPPLFWLDAFDKSVKEIGKIGYDGVKGAACDSPRPNYAAPEPRFQMTPDEQAEAEPRFSEDYPDHDDMAELDAAMEDA
jgi:hypothetical protein